MFNKTFDHELFARVITLTKKIAIERGIMWEEEQAEIAYEIIRNDYKADE